MSQTAAARVRIGVVLLVVFVLQTTLGADLRLFGVGPDPMLLLAICAGLTGGAEAGAIVGFACGLLADLSLSATPLGLSALSWCLVGWTVGTLRATVLPETRTALPVIAFASTAGGVIVFLVIGDVVGSAQLIHLGRSYLVRVALVEALWSALLAIPVASLYERAARNSPGSNALRPDALAGRVTR